MNVYIHKRKEKHWSEYNCWQKAIVNLGFNANYNWNGNVVLTIDFIFVFMFANKKIEQCCDH